MASFEMPDSNLVHRQMAKVLHNFDSLRGIKPDANRFWDAVIITAADIQQQQCFEKQMKSKEERAEIPLGVHYLVYADPPGCKAGSGGSILNALNRMREQIGDETYKYRTLVICAGGWSQRLPTASILGKLFLPLPIGPKDRHYQMIDLKLALYLPFFERMKLGGFLVTCSDDIETYYLPEEQNLSDVSWSFDSPGFVALGHISSLDVAKGHGVYVLPAEAHTQAQEMGVAVSKSLLVLQKPSLELMRDTGATLHDNWACTDSVFAFDREVARSLMDTYGQNKPLTSEVDAYADFLRAFGSESNDPFRKRLRDALKDYPVTVVLLRQSCFYHAGTMPEYLQMFASSDRGLGFELSFRTWKGTLGPSCNGATVMRSVLHPEVCLGTGTVVEYCEISGPVSIGDRCLVSHCRIRALTVSDPITVPPDCCFHTVSVTVNGSLRYVTIAFGVWDDVKRSGQRASELIWLGQPLNDLAEFLPVPKNSGPVSLWNLRLFAVADTMESSFQKTLECVTGALKGNVDIFKRHISPWLSMEDILEMKNFDDMLQFRDTLHQLIESDTASR